MQTQPGLHTHHHAAVRFGQRPIQGRTPTQGPGAYRSLRGLLRATERVLQLHCQNAKIKIAGQSTAMWLTNAEYEAKTNFRDETSVQALRKKYAATRHQDLVGGTAVFGQPLPTRQYEVGDCVPGLGEITDLIDTGNGLQFEIGGQWIHERCFGSAA